MLQDNNYFSDKLSYGNDESYNNNYQFGTQTALKERETFSENEQISFSRQNSYEDVQDPSYLQNSFDAALRRTRAEDDLFDVSSRDRASAPKRVINNDDDIEEDYPVRPVQQVQRPTSFEMEDRIVTQTITADFPTTYTHTKTKIRLSKKVKTVLTFYTLLMLALVAILVLSVLALTGINSNVEDLEAQVAGAESEVGILAGELDGLNNPDQIKGNAGDMGMVETPDAVKEMELPPIMSNGSFKAEGNWFDDVCDFISNLFS